MNRFCFTAKTIHFVKDDLIVNTVLRIIKGLHSAKEQICPFGQFEWNLVHWIPQGTAAITMHLCFQISDYSSKSTTLTHSTGKILPPFLNCLLKIFFFNYSVYFNMSAEVYTYMSNLVSYSKVFTKTLLLCNYLKSNFPSFYNFFPKILLSLSFILDKFQGVNTEFHFIKSWPYVLLLFMEKILDIKNR